MKIDHYQEYRDTGEILEVFQTYETDEKSITIQGAPRFQEINEILELLRKTSIKKITITR